MKGIKGNSSLRKRHNSVKFQRLMMYLEKAEAGKRILFGIVK